MQRRITNLLFAAIMSCGLSACTDRMGDPNDIAMVDGSSGIDDTDGGSTGGSTGHESDSDESEGGEPSRFDLGWPADIHVDEPEPEAPGSTCVFGPGAPSIPCPEECARIEQYVLGCGEDWTCVPLPLGPSHWYCTELPSIGTCYLNQPSPQPCPEDCHWGEDGNGPLYCGDLECTLFSPPTPGVYWCE